MMMSTQSTLPGPAYRIHSHRLVIRCWAPTDASLVHSPFVVTMAHLHALTPWAQDESEDLQARIDRLRYLRSEFDLGRQLMYGVFNCPETELLGYCGLCQGVVPEVRSVVCSIYHDFVNHGIATETVAALTRVAFEIGQVQRLEILTDPDNPQCTAVPGKLGYTHEATLRKNELTVTGDRRDTMIWALLAEDYPTSPAALAEVEAFDVIGRRIL